jgi:hypothetical protein
MTSNFQLLEYAQKKHLGKVSILCKDELSKVKLRPNLNFIINMSLYNMKITLYVKKMKCYFPYLAVLAL